MIPLLRASLTVALVLALALAGAEARQGDMAIPVPQSEIQPIVDIFPVKPEAMPKAVWAQYDVYGTLEVRAVVEEDRCPELQIDQQNEPVQWRAAKDVKFPLVCVAVIPKTAKSAEFIIPRDENGKIVTKTIPLPVPVSDPQRILVLGDTGCRIKGKALQDCSKENEWPFARIAAEAAKLKPDLVIHVGDYLYRENACPADFPGCQGTPFGDNWPTWDADFFAPAKPLLAAAPWVIVRGNHEDCQRAGPGFLRLLGPSAFDPAAACSDHLPPYAIPFAALNLVVGDNVDAPEQSVVEKSVPIYRAEIAALANEKAPTWWLTHRPIWGLVSGPLDVPVGGNKTLIAAAGKDGIPAPVELMLAGHIHTFEAINYEPENHVPPQLIAGFGGDRLDPTPQDLRGAIFQGSSGVEVRDGVSIGGFGFVLMTRVERDWRIDVYDWQGRIRQVCWFQDRRLNCPHKKR